MIQDWQRRVIGGDDQDQIRREPADGTAETRAARRSGPAGQQDPFNGAMQPGISRAAKSHLMAGGLKTRHRIFGPVRDTAALADNEYLHRMSQLGNCPPRYPQSLG